MKEEKEARNEAVMHAERLAYKYAQSLDVGHERTKAFEIYENLRNAGRVY